MADVCPKCGADRVNKEKHIVWSWEYKCGSAGDERYFARSDQCKDRQIANLTASRHAWKALYEAYSEYGMGTYFTFYGEAAVNAAKTELKRLGEWD